VLEGVEFPTEGLVFRSWLYHVEPLPPDRRVLLWGEAIDSERPDAPERQPVPWVRERPRAEGLPTQRIAFTTLGHSQDFTNAALRVIAVQMIAWALGDEARMDDSVRVTIRQADLELPSMRSPDARSQD
jgi:hypothetical protein